MEYRFSEIKIGTSFRWEGSEYNKTSEEKAIKIKTNDEVAFNDHIIVKVKEK